MQTISNEALFQEAQEVIPGGVNSPARAFKHVGGTPLYFKKGEGEMIVDEEDRGYIDYCCGYGALIHGHAHPEIVESAIAQVRRGSTFAMATAVEHQYAKRIIAHMPSIEKLRFVNSGTEASMTALRVARAFTGRSLIVKFNGHYHGHSDQLLINAGSGVAYLAESSSQGVPKAMIEQTISLPFNDIEFCRKFIQTRGFEIAAIILEPIAGNMGLVLPEPGFLEMLREETKKVEALLIFDEVITGLRIGLGGSQGDMFIDPDLTCLGKIMGGGYPAAGFGGKAAIMDLLAPQGSVYQAGTCSGNPVAMWAGMKTLDLIEEDRFYSNLAEKTRNMMEPIRERIEQKNLPVTLNYTASCFCLYYGVKKVKSWEDVCKMDREMFKRYFHHMLQGGIFIPPSPYEINFLSAAHTTESLNRTQNRILSFLESEF